MTDRGGFAKISRDLRKEVGCCELCGSSENLEVHHKIALGNGGKNDKHNLIVVCRTCHDIYFTEEHSKATKKGIEKLRCPHEQLISLTELYLLIDKALKTEKYFFVSSVLDVIDDNIHSLKRQRSITLVELSKKYPEYAGWLL